MDLKIEWMEILMVLGAAVGGILSIIVYAITKSDLSLLLFVIFTLGGAVLGIATKLYIARTMKKR